MVYSLIVYTHSPVGSRPPTPKSDTEYEIADRKEAACLESEPIDHWKWGQLPDSSMHLASAVTTQVPEPERTPGELFLQFINIFVNMC